MVFVMLNPMEASDRDLVEAAREGDDDALRLLMERHLQAVYRLCLRLTGSATDAEDAAQEAMVKAWRNLARFDEEQAFRPWLFTIARNSATDLMRKRRSLPFSAFADEDGTIALSDTLADPEPLPEEILANSMEGAEAAAALRTLPARDQALLALRYQDELSFEDISTVLAMPANTVRSIHRRALIALRKRLGPRASE